MPKVSVLLPVYNGELFLKEAIESILSQTFRDFEFIIIDDGSTDGTSAILEHYQQMDDRIQIYRHGHRGLVPSLKRGCHLARGEYIARMDADDVSLPERLARQVEYLETHPEIGVLGCAVQIIDGRGKKTRILQFPTEHAVLKWRLCFFISFTFAHPAVVMRRDLVERVGGYNPEMGHPEDYELWRQLIWLTRLSNLSDVLLYLRKHEASYTRVPLHLMEQIKNGIRVSQLMVSQVLGEEIPVELIQPLCTLEFKTWNDVKRVSGLVYRIYQAMMADRTLVGAEKRMIRLDAFKQVLFLMGETVKKPLHRMFCQ